MKILMDADCLIKLTKAGLKECICEHVEIFIPDIVKKEVVNAGKNKGCPDADSVERNISDNIIRVAQESSKHIKGDQALIETFKRGRYDGVATDDAKLLRFLGSMGIPFILPGLFIYSFYQRGLIDPVAALNWLEKLSPFISEDESSMVKLLMEKKS